MGTEDMLGRYPISMLTRTLYQMCQILSEEGERARCVPLTPPPTPSQRRCMCIHVCPPQKLAAKGCRNLKLHVHVHVCIHVHCSCSYMYLRRDTGMAWPPLFYSQSDSNSRQTCSVFRSVQHVHVGSSSYNNVYTCSMVKKTKVFLKTHPCMHVVA